MKITIDDIARVHLIDDFSPYGSIIFDVYDEKVSVYQDAESQTVRTAFETIDESAEFDRYELAKGLREIAELLEGDELNGHTL